MLVNIQLNNYHYPNKYATLLWPLCRQKFVNITYRCDKIGGVGLIAVTSFDRCMVRKEQKSSIFKSFIYPTECTTRLKFT
jgi:hypothetical protein